jgi:hypothetical protein
MPTKNYSQGLVDPNSPLAKEAMAAALEDPVTARKELIDRAAPRRFSLETAPPVPVPRFFINGKPMFTPRNIGALQAQAGSGKTSYLAASMAAMIAAARGDDTRDCLGIRAADPKGAVLLHVDTEQSPYDHHTMIRRALRRAGVEAPPPNLHSFGLAGFGARDLRRFLKFSMEDLTADGQSLFAVIVDGTADLVRDVNDAEECNEFVAELHDLAIRFDTSILNVIHENPAQDSGKARGHLGSQLERKAETVLRLKRSDDLTVAFTTKARQAPIFEKDGPRFRWSDAEGMHVSVATAGAVREDAKTAKLRELAGEIFENGAQLTYSEARDAVVKARGCTPRWGEKQVDAMKAAGVIRTAGGGKYAFV